MSTIKPVFPILITENDEEATSYVSIRYADNFMRDDNALFYLVNGSLRKADNQHSPSDLRVVMKNGTDEENDRASLAHFSIDSLILENAWEDTFVFTGWLTEALFYLENESPINPDYEDDELPVYNYIPPKRQIDNLKLPLKVEVTLRYNVPNVNSVLSEAMEDHESVRVELAAKREAERQAKIERREQAAKEQAEWLKTPEGEAFLIEKNFNTEAKKFYKQDFTTSGKKEEALNHLLNHIENLSDAEQDSLIDSLNNRLWRYPDSNVEELVKEITDKFSV